MIRISLILLGFLLFFLFFSSCEKQTAADCKGKDRACFSRFLQAHPIKKIDYWEKYFQGNISERIYSAPEAIIDYLSLENRSSGFLDETVSAVLMNDFSTDIKQAISALPDTVKKLLHDKLIGIFLVEGLGSTGFSDAIMDAGGQPRFGYIVLDVGVLDRVANQWATWKESTPFKDNPDFRIEAIIERNENNSRENAIQYILLHEFGHILSIGERFHPYWGNAPPNNKDLQAYAFSSESWLISKNRYISVFEKTLPARDQIVYYLGARLAAEHMLEVYTDLEKTNFSTLYAATNPFDDFAESFASYVHTVLMKKPFEIRIIKNNVLMKVYRTCWDEVRCARKKAILYKLVIDGDKNY